MTAVELSVVIPAYNEAARIGPTVRRIVEHLRATGRGAEILVVDDGSDDDTAGAVERFGEPEVRVLRLPENRGTPRRWPATQCGCAGGRCARGTSPPHRGSRA